MTLTKKLKSTGKAYAQAAYGSKTFTHSQIKSSTYDDEILATNLTFKRIGRILWGTPKPVMTMIKRESGIPFVPTKMVPPPLWNACDLDIHFVFTIANNFGKMSRAAEFLNHVWRQTRKKSSSYSMETCSLNLIKSTLN